MGETATYRRSQFKAFVQPVLRLPSDGCVLPSDEWVEGVPQILSTFMAPFHNTPLAEDKHWVPGMRNGNPTRDKERVKMRERAISANSTTPSSQTGATLPPRPATQVVSNGSPSRPQDPPHLAVHRGNGKAARAFGPPPRWGLTPLQSAYEHLRARHPPPPPGALAPPFGAGPGVGNGVPRHHLDPHNITYATLRAFLSGAPGPVVRVYHHRSRARLIWDGNAGSSGFSAEMFRALSPETYARAMDDAQLSGRWGLGPGVREVAAKHVLGQMTDEPSPWISATANLDSAIAVIAHELALGATEVRLAVIVPTTEVRLPAVDVLKPALAGSPVGAGMSRGEWLFYGRIFTRSVIADIRWTRARLPFDLPPKFWKPVRGHETSWVKQLRWDATTALWPSIRLILQRPPEVVHWAGQVPARQSWQWPVADARVNGSTGRAAVQRLSQARNNRRGGQQRGSRYPRQNGTPKDLLGAEITPLDCLDDSDGEVDSELPAPLAPVQLDLLEM